MAKLEETITIKLNEGILEVLSEIRDSLRLIGLLLVRNQDRPIQVCLNCGFRLSVDTDPKGKPCCQNQHVVMFSPLDLKPEAEQKESEQ